MQTRFSCSSEKLETHELLHLIQQCFGHIHQTYHFVRHLYESIFFCEKSCYNKWENFSFDNLPPTLHTLNVSQNNRFLLLAEIRFWFSFWFECRLLIPKVRWWFNSLIIGILFIIVTILLIENEFFLTHHPSTEERWRRACSSKFQSQPEVHFQGRIVPSLSRRLWPLHWEIPSPIFSKRIFPKVALFQSVIQKS